MKKKWIGIVVLVVLCLSLVGVGIYFLTVPKGTVQYEYGNYQYEIPAKFSLLTDSNDYTDIFKINSANVITVDEVANFSMSPKGYADMRTYQHGVDGNENITVTMMEIGGYPGFLFEADAVSEGEEFHIYCYYIFAGKLHLELGGIFEKDKSDKYESYVDAVVETVVYVGEREDYQQEYDDGETYIKASKGLYVEKYDGDDSLTVKYIAEDNYVRSFSSMHIEKLTDVEGDLGDYVQTKAESREGSTITEEVLLGKYAAFCVSREVEMEMAFSSQIDTYYFEKDGEYYKVHLATPVGDEECRETYLQILETWK